MLDPSFWVARIANPDRVLMSLDGIMAMNKMNAARIIPADHPYRDNIDRIEMDGPLFNVVDPLSKIIDVGRSTETA